MNKFKNSLLPYLEEGRQLVERAKEYSGYDEKNPLRREWNNHFEEEFFNPRTFDTTIPEDNVYQNLHRKDWISEFNSPKVETPECFASEKLALEFKEALENNLSLDQHYIIFINEISKYYSENYFLKDIEDSVDLQALSEKLLFAFDGKGLGQYLAFLAIRNVDYSSEYLKFCSGIPILSLLKELSKNHHGLKPIIQKRELSIMESREFWKNYFSALNNPKLIPKLLEKIPKENTLIFVPNDFNIISIENDLNRNKFNSYLPKRNPKTFEIILKRMRGLYFHSFPYKSLL